MAGTHHMVKSCRVLHRQSALEFRAFQQQLQHITNKTKWPLRMKGVTCSSNKSFQIEKFNWNIKTVLKKLTGCVIKQSLYFVFIKTVKYEAIGNAITGSQGENTVFFKCSLFRNISEILNDIHSPITQDQVSST